MFAKDNLIHKYSLKRLERLYVEMFSYLFSSAELVISNIKIFRANNSLSLIINKIMLGEEGGGWLVGKIHTGVLKSIVYLLFTAIYLIYDHILIIWR